MPAADRGRRPLLVVTTSFPRTEGDPAGSFVASAVADLRARGHAVDVLAPGSGVSPPGVGRLEYAAPGGLLGGSGAPDLLEASPVRAWAAATAAVAALTAAVARYAPTHDRVVAHWLVPCGLAGVLAGGDRPVYAYAHGGDVALLERLPGGAALARSLDARAAGLIFVSDDLRRRFAARLGRAPRSRHVVLPMGFTPSRPDPGRISNSFNALRLNGRRVVVTVGRLVPVKGLDVLARALAGRDDVTWIAAGEGPERQRLADLARSYGVDLRLPGVVSPADRDALFALADVVALPSRVVGRRSEGTPLVLLEAMAAGRPIVATATGGVPEVAGPGVRQVGPDDPAALREALDAWLDDRGAAARAGHANARHALRYTWDALGADHVAALGLL